MRRRAPSTASSKSSTSMYMDQELDALYDYLAKIILLGPSGCGKSCILHRFVKGDWKILTSQTIGVEFSSKIIKVGQGASKRGMKLQLWDTAGQERFKSLTRGYYRGSAGVLLVYDITSRESFNSLKGFIADIRALTTPNTSIIVLGNKVDLEIDADPTTVVPHSEAMEFCLRNGNIPLMYTSALTGENVTEAFSRLAEMILTKVELGHIDPEDIDSGVQYGEITPWDHTLPRSQGRSLITLMGGRRDSSTNRRGVIDLDWPSASHYSCC
ncbi:GTP-binding protein Ypt31p/YPT8 [Trichomonascus vanleenenianus]|uniref:Rab family GTPase n=1 Tax=Trichomonascus vanleenenianus TaxID=2268995 RepID=UPI003EC9E022